MYTVTIENPCRCSIRNALPDVQTFDTKEAAEAEAKSLLKYMQDNFCKKHTFSMMPYGLGFKVSIREA